MYNYSVHSTGTSTRMKKVWTTFNYLITFVKYKIRKIGKEQKNMWDAIVFPYKANSERGFALLDRKFCADSTRFL